VRLLLSTIGSRGDVEPLLALALELKALGQEVRICAPPDFEDWVNGFEIDFLPIGPLLRPLTATSTPTLSARPSAERLRELAIESVNTQFKTVAAAAEGCDILLAGGALQIAAHSVAEARGTRYIYASYCPITLPSLRHAPPVLTVRGEVPYQGPTDNADLWAKDAVRLNVTFGSALNDNRTRLGLAPVEDVRSYVFTDRPWLAADRALAPWPEPHNGRVFQPGAWIRPDERPLAPELESFLEAGDAPIYFGLGSMRAAQPLAEAMMEAARSLGRRAILSRGWADLSLAGDAADSIEIGEVNQQALFKRVAAVVHHGGAGTTTTATRAGAPQVAIPQGYDQFYWARRVEELGIGKAHPYVPPTSDTLQGALRAALDAEVLKGARSFAAAARIDGAAIAARRLLELDS
jgi:vancomycin aglycone glucosyltransferase